MLAEDQEVGRLVAKIAMDDSGLNKSMAQLNREMKIAKTAFDANTSGVNLLAKAEDQLKIKTDGLNRQLDLQQQKVTLLYKKYQEVSAAKGKDARETQKLEAEVNKAVTAYNKLQNELTQTQTKLDQQTSAFNKLSGVMQNAETKLNSFGSVASDVGQGIALLTLPLAGVGVVATKTAIQFESAMAGVNLCPLY